MTDLTQDDFSALLAELRPRLHRYCARMVGSAIDGEDVVQEALAKAAEAFPTAGRIERPESWLLRIAHNASLDALRRSKRQADLHVDLDLTEFADAGSQADARVATAASLTALLHLPPAQRSSVVLMDVLGHSLAETAEIINVSVPSVKAALHRGRARLQTFTDDTIPMLDAAERDRLRNYADRFNARDFDALRALLADDVKLDLVNRARFAGRKDESDNFTRYSGSSDWKFAPGIADGRPALLVRDPHTDAVTYLVLLTWKDGKIAAIRDFRYAQYIVESLR
ncbi:MAG: polymerase, sigma-24 subunit, subfamily [Rhodospirillales bacterium]|nr:polymerase, sigma-24 subunit, subfamily [Rhodospirillales bacterium]